MRWSQGMPTMGGRAVMGKTSHGRMRADKREAVRCRHAAMASLKLACDFEGGVRQIDARLRIAQGDGGGQALRIHDGPLPQFQRWLREDDGDVAGHAAIVGARTCLLYTSPSPR